jgi:hypothetical protein
MEYNELEGRNNFKAGLNNFISLDNLEYWMEDD